MKPEILAQVSDRPRFTVVEESRLLGYHVSRKRGRQAVYQRNSDDGGRKWCSPHAIFDLPPAVPPEAVGAPPQLAGRKPPQGTEPVGCADDLSAADPVGRWGGCQVVLDREQEVHLFLVNDRGTGVLLTPEEREKAPPLGRHDRRLDVWHMRSHQGRQRWSQPRRIWTGYTGSINSALCTASGRLILPFSMLTHRSWRDRGPEPGAFTFLGTSTTIVLFSDDNGHTWQRAEGELTVETPSIGTYGAVEPVVVERSDGQLWMLIRTQKGRLYESTSTDGSAWGPARPSALVSSDSPAGLVRLADGGLCLLWNKCQRFPYAHGGRHVLHAAVSADQGRTWCGQREVAADPLRHQPPPLGGDHGTAYPFPVALPDGRVLASTGQGEGRVLLIAVDPTWLLEREQEADLAADAGAWHAFGCRGVCVDPEGGPEKRPALTLRRAAPPWETGATWNMPCGAAGWIALRVCLDPGSSPLRLLLTDHFSVPFDLEDVLHAVYVLDLAADGTLSSGGRLDRNTWHELILRWDCGSGTCAVELDGRGAGSVRAARRCGGVNYLRLHAAGEQPASGAFRVAGVRVVVSRHPGPE